MLAARAVALNAPVRTARLRLDPLTNAHAAIMFPALQDPLIYTWISTPPPTSAEELGDRWRRAIDTRLSPDGAAAYLNWAVRLADGDTVVGKLDAVVTEGDVATNVGYLFFPPHWGRGFATEAMTALSLHLATLGVAEQHATVTVGNVASYRVLEKAGFRDVGLLAQNDVIRGVACDDHHFVRSSSRPAPSSRSGSSEISSALGDRFGG